MDMRGSVVSLLKAGVCLSAGWAMVLVAPAAGWGAGYSGSQSCQVCHRMIYDAYMQSNHHLYVQPATPETVIGDFTTNNTLKAGEVETRMSRKGDQFFVTTLGPDGNYHDYLCRRVVGFYFKQRYETILPEDGRPYILPIQWNKNEKRWVDYHGPTKAKPGDGEFWCDAGRSTVVQCAGCHDTGVRVSAAAPEKLTAAIAEEGIGCETCHGPCGDHVKNPEDQAALAKLSALSVQRQVDVCGQCHGRGQDPSTGTHYPHAFLPGDRLLRSFNLVEPVFGTMTDDCWPDGRALSHHQQYTEYIGSAHYREAGMTCTTCHDPHVRERYGMLKASAEADEICLSCHAELRGAKQLKAHTHHDVEKEGSRCLNCHMPKVIKHEQPMQMRHHGFSSPDPLKTAAWGSPNACSICHTDKDKYPPEKLAAIMQSWGIVLQEAGTKPGF